MKINVAVINGTEKKGVTWHLKEAFLVPLKDHAEITEFSLPKDCPNFCCGCANCFMKRESFCKDAKYVKPIENAIRKADLIVFTSPVYALHASGAMKNLLDHFAWRFINHRPAAEIFTKRAVVITQCVGAGAASTIKDMKDSLSWWGISRIYTLQTRLMDEIVWSRLPEEKRDRLERKAASLAEKLMRKDLSRPVRAGIVAKVKFLFVRKMQKGLHEKDPEYLDGKYWSRQGWLDECRPWKQNGKKSQMQIMEEA